MEELKEKYERLKKMRDELIYMINDKNLEIEKLQNKYFRLKKGIKKCLNDESGDYDFIKYELQNVLNSTEGKNDKT